MAPRQDRFTQQNRPRPMGDGNKGQSAQNRGNTTRGYMAKPPEQGNPRYRRGR